MIHLSSIHWMSLMTHSVPPKKKKKITATTVSDDTHEETVPNPEGHCTVRIEPSDPKDQYAEKAEPCESTSGAARRAAGFHCRLPSTMIAVYNLRLGEFVTSGIGVSALLTGHVRSKYWDTRTRTCFCRKPRLKRPPSPLEISPQLKHMIPCEKVRDDGQAP